MLLAVGFGRWTERHHPAIPLAGGLAIAALAAFVLVFAENIPAVAVGTTALGIGHMSGAIGAQSIMAQADSRSRASAGSARSPLSRRWARSSARYWAG